ncbi:unnamed protein product [Lasius platythorax]|uniref:Uncharacterized protein n=1 Tax=Lasius platythorax TaxID=488582 RepID=A0AAV2NJH6_9HYME
MGDRENIHGAANNLQNSVLEEHEFYDRSPDTQVKIWTLIWASRCELSYYNENGDKEYSYTRTTTRILEPISLLLFDLKRVNGVKYDILML